MKSIVKIFTILFSLFLINNTTTVFANSNNSHNIKTYDDLITLSIQLEKIEQELPNLSHVKKNNLLKKFITEGNLSKIETRSSSYKSLTPEEKKLANENPLYAAYVGLAAKKAENLTKKTYGYSGTDDYTDAFRHMLWNALMKRSVGLNFTKRWADAHESQSSGLAKQMDLYNNHLGQQLPVANKSDSQLASMCDYKVKAGHARMILNGKLVKTRILHEIRSLER